MVRFNPHAKYGLHFECEKCNWGFIDGGYMIDHEMRCRGANPPPIHMSPLTKLLRQWFGYPVYP